MKNAQIPILGFAAYSGTGKTTLLTQLIPLLQNSDIRVGLIKHSHHNFEIDKPDKDSYRLRKAGASPVMLVSNHKRAIITEFESIIEPKLDIQLKFFDQSELDLILVEGFKAENFPKIELYRPALNNPLLFPNDPSIIAIATDKKIAQLSDSFGSKSMYPALLDINNPAEICSFIMGDFLRATK
ncbi:MAG: molybdopterin-guanine dinucleotide biosynthesis protein B [Methylococcales symbiont of Iophon sp. n. MRB-2018]|nr:MAG: molybdopterin-guanine dinucleotide biosynthesis protein B [Methylococcales symbiont of Iophon sp. n. MRB-2018]KAF3979515.1 MAG: molybdopterin-guanine dinucleotide biosynthesis protein B [Methylococcales symbiont of Iophon sp. n. MRB-2018]